MPKSSFNPNRRLNSFRNLLWLRKERKLGLLRILSVCRSSVTHLQAGMMDVPGVHLKVTVVVPVTTTLVLVSVLVTGYG